MSDLTVEERIYLIECFFSREKVYSSGFRFREGGGGFVLNTEHIKLRMKTQRKN